MPVAKDVRPTEGRVREALFSIWGERLVGARVLDLFAGSGAVALEAVGRGAASALCVEMAPRVLRTLEDNVRRLGEEGLVETRRGKLPEMLAQLAVEGRRFDLAFADPPYRFTGYAEIVAAVAPLLSEEGELVVEHSARRELPLEVAAAGGGSIQVRVDVRRYGESALSFYRRGAA
jgi:16S rRNA (guanine(966)-N(2))-methyltransferase RsmD